MACRFPLICLRVYLRPLPAASFVHRKIPDQWMWIVSQARRVTAAIKKIQSSQQTGQFISVQIFRPPAMHNKRTPWMTPTGDTTADWATAAAQDAKITHSSMNAPCHVLQLPAGICFRSFLLLGLSMPNEFTDDSYICLCCTARLHLRLFGTNKSSSSFSPLFDWRDNP